MRGQATESDATPPLVTTPPLPRVMRGSGLRILWSRSPAGTHMEKCG
jgi:hypothetical protein